MPDITLYADDMELIFDLVNRRHMDARAIALTRVMPESHYELIAKLDALESKVFARLSQKLHPAR